MCFCCRLFYGFALYLDFELAFCHMSDLASAPHDSPLDPLSASSDAPIPF